MSFDHKETIATGRLFDNCIQLGMQSFTSLVHLCHYVMQTQHLAGDIVEFGCYKGDTAKLITAITNKKVYVYDSFAGLPATGETPAGGMATTVATLVENFKRDNVRLPVIKQGWFSDVQPHELPAEISFAHVDGDLFRSTLDALRLIYPRLVPGSIVLFDDYDGRNPSGWPNVRNAVQTFMADKPEKVVELQGACSVYAFRALFQKQ